MRARKITQLEKRKIEKLYESSIFFKLEETLVSTFFVFILILFSQFIIQKIISVSGLSYLVILFIAFPIGLLIIQNKYKKRKILLKKIFSKREPVEIHYFNIQRFINVYPQSKHQLEYLCEIDDSKTLFFIADKNLGEKLSRKLKIETIEIEIPPIILSVSKIGTSTATEIFPKELNITRIFEENTEHGFYIEEKPINYFYQ